MRPVLQQIRNVGEHVGISASFENASGNSNVLHVSNVNDETGNNIPYEVSELPVPETRSDRQSYTHHMMTGQTVQTNQFLELITGCILSPRNSASPNSRTCQHKYVKTTTYQWLNKHQEIKTWTQSNSINRLADAIAGIATQQQAQ